MGKKLTGGNMKKIISIFVITFISMIILPFSVKALNITELNVENNEGKLTVSGTTENGVYAVAVLVYSGSDLVHMETCSNDNGYNCELNKSLDPGTYTIKVADYNGGDYITKDFTIEEENNNTGIENPETGDEIVSSIVIGSISLIGLIGCALYFNKKKKLN